MQGRPDPNMITEEDMIEIQLLDDYITKIEFNFQRKRELWEEFISECKKVGHQKCIDLNVDSAKTKAQISQAMFAQELNGYLER